jgi:hypothetical protein
MSDNLNVNVFYKRNEEIYLGATIRTLRERIELFYHYPLGGK